MSILDIKDKKKMCYKNQQQCNNQGIGHSEVAISKYTIELPKARGYSILSEISAMLKDLPIGNQSTQLGLKGRKAWFHNSCLGNSEVWNGISGNDLHALAVTDNSYCKIFLGQANNQKFQQQFYFLKPDKVQFII